MKLFNWMKNRKKSFKPNSPKSSYILYNENETQEITSEEKELLVAYDENLDTNEIQIQEDAIFKNIKEQKRKDNKDTKMAAKTPGSRNIYYVSVRKSKEGKKIGWEVKKEKAAKITKLCSTKEEAITLVKELAGNQGSTCIIRKMDGSIQETLKFDINKSK